MIPTTVITESPRLFDGLPTAATATPALSIHQRDVPPAPSKHLVLTDQTNLLPFKTIVTVFMGLACCVVVSSLDSVVVATALPTVSEVFHAGSVISWVPSAYFLTSAAFQPMYGRLSDIFGRKATLFFAMATFVVGSLAAGFSRDIVELIFFRAVAGAGGGGILSLTQIIISDIVSLQERGKYQGIIISVNGLANAIGPPLGGALAEKASWRWCFWITIPIALGSMVVIHFALPLKRVQGDMKRKWLAIDYLGAALTLAGCTLIVLPLIWGGVTFPWSSPNIIAPLLSGLLVVVLFCVWEWRGARLPIVPMHIFKHKTVTGVLMCMFVNGFIFYSSLFYLPQFFQVALGFSPIRAGTFVLPIPLGLSVANISSGYIVSRTSRYRILIYSGFLLWAIGCGCISTITPATPKALVVFLMIISGLGAGMTQQTSTIAAQASVPRKDMAIVIAMWNLTRLLGCTLSIAISASLINNFLRKFMASFLISPASITAIVNNPALLGISGNTSELSSLGIVPSEAALILSRGYNRGFKYLFILHACLAVLAALVSFLMVKETSLLRGDEEELRQDASQAVKLVERRRKRAEQGFPVDEDDKAL
ncbi:MFS general substrate transporter [Athelia psychrophila]|uniref:MFS general substrate transporter n=1 Tax=Athelia psychrophila TaxID=1759441 RepID=A0A166WD99_9AGAM|nr:MFS general substrate transporter [Fibularhizoctonia sp. CBS 109695]